MVFCLIIIRDRAKRFLNFRHFRQFSSLLAFVLSEISVCLPSGTNPEADLPRCHTDAVRFGVIPPEFNFKLILIAPVIGVQNFHGHAFVVKCDIF